jgi:predicted dehydrogenase
MMAATLDEFYIMKEAAERSGKVLLEAMRPTFDPAYTVLSLALGEIGRVRRATLEFCQYSSRYDRFKAGILTNAFDPGMKNSALSDIGIYPLNIAINLFGAPDKIDSSSVFLHNGFEGEGSAILSYSDKLCAIIYSKISDSVNPSVIEGEEGSILIDKLTSPQRILLKKRGGEIKELDFPKTDNNMTYEIETFVKMAEGELSYRDHLLLTEKTQIAVDKIYKASKIDSRF